MFFRCFLLFILIFLLAPCYAADTIYVSIPVEDYAPEVVDGAWGTWIDIPGAPTAEDIGAPAVPEVPLKIALPACSRVTSLSVEVVGYTPWRNVPDLMPVSDQVPVSRPWEFQQAEPDPVIYSNSAFYPECQVRLTGSGVVWGIPVATAVVNPVRWNPATGELEVMSELRVSLELERDPALPSVRRRARSSEARAIDLARRLVVNPQEVSGSGACLVDERELEYGQYVIICPSDYADELQVLADWKTSKGVPAAVYTTDWIEANYGFLDIQREIRAFLTDCRDEGTDYVLLAGDHDVLEARFVYLCGGFRPSDLYFSDINDAYPGEDLWDSNRNGYWAEPGDDVDWHPDLWTARASVRCGTEAELFVDKVLFYEHVDQSWRSGSSPLEPPEMRIGYSTGMLNDDPLCWGSAGAEVISGYIPADWQEEKRYESEDNNSSVLTIEMINMGMHHIYHSSHGAPTLMWTSWGSEFTVDHILALENISSGGNVSIWNSISCLIGAFDTAICCADAWMISPDGGGFGAFNSASGYFNSSQPGNGVSEQLCQRFYYEYLFNDVLEIGIAHGASLDYFCPPAWNSYFEYTIKSYNLFGDPELPMWTQESESLAVVHPSSINGNSTVEVTVSSGGAPLEDARVCIQKGDWKTGEVYDIQYTDAAGTAQLWASPETIGQMDITVWAYDHDHYSGTIDVSGVGIEPEYGGLGHSLVSVFPNPAAEKAAVTYTASSTCPVNITVYDMQGRLVRILVSGAQSSGTHTVQWDLDRTEGNCVSSGLYFVRLNSAGSVESRRLLILR